MLTLTNLNALIYSSIFSINFTPVQKGLKWIAIKDRSEFKVCFLIYDTFQCNQPSYTSLQLRPKCTQLDPRLQQFLHSSVSQQYLSPVVLSERQCQIQGSATHCSHLHVLQTLYQFLHSAVYPDSTPIFMPWLICHRVLSG